MDFVVPKKPFSNGRARSKRRSSILKTARPLEEIQNVSCGDDKLGRSRRVSFANTIEVKEFSKEKPTRTDELQDNVIEQSAEFRNTGIIAGDGTDGEIQISTPVKKKPRRISAVTTNKIERLSIIPKLPPSPMDQEFEIYEDDVHVTTAANHDIILVELPDKSPFSEQVDEEANCFGAFTEASLSVDLDDKLPHCSVPSQNSCDMELTLVDMSLTCMEPGTCTLKQNDGSVNEAHVNDEIITSDKNAVMSAAKLTVENCQQPNDNIGDACISQANSAPEHSLLTPNKPCLSMSLELPDSVQKTLLSSLKKKRSTTPHACMLVPSASTAAATYQMPHASHSFLEPHQSKLMCSSKYVKTKDHGESFESREGVDSGDVHVNESTNVEAVDMQLEQTVDENRTSLQTTLITESRHGQVLTNNHALVTSEGVSHTEIAKDKTIAANMWLHTVEDLHIPEDACLDILADEPSEGVVSYAETTHSTRNFPCPNSVASFQPICQHRQTSELLKVGQAISTLKSDSNTQYDILNVNTPEATLGERDTILNTSALTHIGFSQTNLEESIASDTLANRQSLMVSPSGFSKFLVKLNCDKTVVEDTPPVQHDPHYYPDASIDEHTIPHQDMSGAKETSLSDCVSTDQVVVTDIFAPETHFEHSNTSETRLLSTSVGCSFRENSIDVSTTKLDMPPLKSIKVSFADSLHIVQHRLTEVINGLQARLTSPEYLRTHEAVKPSLEKLMEAAQNGLCVLILLLRYGELSGLSSTYQWDWERVTRQLPSPILSEEDLTGSSKLKADWIQTTHEELLLKFYPVITTLMEEAARLYPWQLDGLNDKQLQLTCGTFKLTLEFDEQCLDGTSSFNPLFTSIRMYPEEADDGHRISEQMLNSHSITDIAETLWSLKL